VILPPAIALHRWSSRSSVDAAATTADQRMYPFRASRTIMNDPSPSSIPASHALSVIVIPQLYIGSPTNSAYVAMADRRVRGPLFAEATP
jgi:hypothetical protein